MKNVPLIVFIHDFINVSDIIILGTEIPFEKREVIGEPIVKAMFTLAQKSHNTLIGWCHEAYVNSTNMAKWETLVNHELELITYEPSGKYWIDNRIGYVDFTSPFIHNIPSNIRFGTWQASASIGLISSETLLQFSAIGNKVNDIRTLLVAIGKIGETLGLFSYSEPLLINSPSENPHLQASSIKATLQFIKSYYGLKWTLFFILCNLIYKNKLRLDWLLMSLFIRKLPSIKTLTTLKNLENNEIISSNDTIEVIIPTLGRAHTLKDVLDDLSNQSLLPNTVIIVEQISTANGVSELDYLNNIKYPFSIKHKLIHELGACNARNVAITNLGQSEWVFFADDDIRIDSDTLINTIAKCKQYKLDAITIAVYQRHEQIERKKYPIVWNNFGSGCSIVKTIYVTTTNFDLNFEFGFGEDTDYGVSLRRKGCTIGYLAQNPILHIKAPIGGFRTQFVHPWSYEETKPSPTILNHYLKNLSSFQLNGYQLFFMINQILKKRDCCFNKMRKRWLNSLKWANQFQQK
jgi:glycosyltransferase involved in cell wall biosynthesis